MKVRVSFYEMYKNPEVEKIQDKEKFKFYVTEWLGVTYRATASICWNMLSSKQLDFD